MRVVFGFVFLVKNKITTFKKLCAVLNDSKDIENERREQRKVTVGDCNFLCDCLLWLSFVLFIFHFFKTGFLYLTALTVPELNL